MNNDDEHEQFCQADKDLTKNEKNFCREVHKLAWIFHMEDDVIYRRSWSVDS